MLSFALVTINEASVRIEILQRIVLADALTRELIEAACLTKRMPGIISTSNGTVMVVTA